MVDEEIGAGDLDQAMAFSLPVLLVALQRSAGTLLK
jgi:hypothetical protein